MSTDYQQLIEAFNEVVRVASKHQVTAPRMKSVLERAIAALDDFITHYDPQLVEPRSPADAGYENRKTFEKVFIAQERTILRKLDLTEDSRTVLIRYARAVIKVEPSQVQRLNISELRKNRDELEKWRALLEAAEGKELQAVIDAKRRVRKNWGRVGKIVGGFVLIAVDISAAAANPGLAITSAISVAAGGNIMNKGL